MRVSFGEPRQPCRNCGREIPASQLDRRLWCSSCRAEVVRRSANVARLFSLAVALALAAWVFYLVGSSSRFMIVYVTLVVMAYFFVYKLTQRVAFEIIRSRGVPPPPPDDG